MKAHYNRISKAQYEAIYNEIRSQQEGITRRLCKLFCIALNETEGMGAKRLKRVMEKVTSLAEEHLTDEIFWNKTDRRVKQLGLGKEFKIDDYDEMGGYYEKN